MKKTLAAAVALLAVIATVSGCSSAAKPHITISTSESEEVPSDTEVPVTEPLLPVIPSIDEDNTPYVNDLPQVQFSSEDLPSGFIANDNIWVDVSSVERESQPYVFYVPKLRDGSEDADSCNARISDFISGCMSDERCTGSDFIYFETNSHIFSVLITAHLDSGDDLYMCVTYDTEESLCLTNEDIMAFAGLDEDTFYGTAAGAVRNVLISRAPADETLFTDTGLNPDSTLGRAADSSEDVRNAYDATFSDTTLNTEMPMFINDSGEICFCSDIVSAEGPAYHTEAYSVSGTTYRGSTANGIIGSASLLDINSDGIKEYIERTSEGTAVIYRITEGSKEEIVTVGSTSLRMTSAYFFEESGFESRPVLRVKLPADEGSLSYELVLVSSDYEEITRHTVTWSDTNADGAITEEDSFLLDGSLSSYSEWYDLTGIV